MNETKSTPNLLRESFTLYGVWVLKVYKGDTVEFEGIFANSNLANKKLETTAGDWASLYFYDLATGVISSHMTYKKKWTQVV